MLERLYKTLHEKWVLSYMRVSQRHMGEAEIRSLFPAPLCIWDCVPVGPLPIDYDILNGLASQPIIYLPGSVAGA